MNPIQNGFAFIIEMKNASVSYPDRVLPAASIIVPEIKSGSLLKCLLLVKKLSKANIAALAFRVSKIVSMKIMCEPPSIRP